jgi:hypothetical protein
MPHLCKSFKRPTKSDKQCIDPSQEPDLYHISALYPVPDKANEEALYQMQCMVVSGPNTRMPVYTGLPSTSPSPMSPPPLSNHITSAMDTAIGNHNQQRSDRESSNYQVMTRDAAPVLETPLQNTENAQRQLLPKEQQEQPQAVTSNWNPFASPSSSLMANMMMAQQQMMMQTALPPASAVVSTSTATATANHPQQQQQQHQQNNSHQQQQQQLQAMYQAQFAAGFAAATAFSEQHFGKLMESMNASPFTPPGTCAVASNIGTTN